MKETTMRPVNRGELPIDSDGKPCVFKKYENASVFLCERLGRYCSYCERIIKTNLAIEHISPKSLNPEKERDWNNFLLSCSNCNSTKGDQEINDKNIDDYFWPDRDNTYRAFVYCEDGTVCVNPELSKEYQEKSRRTLQLFGLDKNPDNGASSKDYRWIDRRNAWGIAQECLQDLRAFEKKAPQLASKYRKSIVRTANDRFSIWFTVFADEPEICNLLIEKFTETARDCFDSKGRPVPRPGREI